jgi:hypothetical protein
MSANVPVFIAVSPSSTVTVALSTPSVGATLLTVSANVVVLTAVKLSVAVIVTVWVSSGPSVVGYDQLQVPLSVPVWVTVPTDAVMVTVSPPVSE